MNIKQISELLEATLETQDFNEGRGIAIKFGVAADLMSDIMIDTPDGSLLVTGLINPQVIRTAEMMNVFNILFVRGKAITDAMIELANEREITLMCSRFSMFEACGRLYNNGIIGGKDIENR